MNLPNKLTLLRIVIVPFMIAAMLWQSLPCNYLIAGILFGIASLTDMLDGKIARKYNLITDFGKFADPLADKILVISAFAVFVELRFVSCISVIIILFREFAVTSVRLVAVENGKVIAANIFGKAKTVSQMIAVIAVLLNHFFLQLVDYNLIPLNNNLEQLQGIVYILDNILIWISVILTLVSGIIYIRDNFEYIKNAK